CRGGAAGNSGPHDIGAGRNGQRRALHRIGRRGLSAKALRPGAAAGAHRRLPGKETLTRSRSLAFATVGRVESETRAARQRAGGAARSSRAAQAFLLAAARGTHRGGWCGRSPRYPPPQPDRLLPRPAWLHRLRGKRRTRRSQERAERVTTRDRTDGTGATKAPEAV